MDVQFVSVLVCLTLFLAFFKSASGDPFSHGSIVYTREQLLALCQAGPPLTWEKPDIPAELRRRKRGCRARVKRREKKRQYKPSVPSVIMGNVRSLPSKMEELTALTRLQREYRECSIMHFREAWLNKLTPELLVTLDGFGQHTLRVVEVKILEVNGVVGKNVSTTCSDWTGWTTVKYNNKYFCKSPCKNDKHILIKAAFGKTNYKNRIQLTNSGDRLLLTFVNLQKSDTNIYYCGVDRVGLDLFKQVNLKVTDAEASSPKTTPKTVIVDSTLTFVVKSSFTISSNGSEITDISTSYIIHSTTTTTPGTQGDGSALYLIICVGVMLTIVMVLLQVMRKMMKKQPKVVSSADVPQEDAQEEYHEIRPVAQQTASHPAGVSTVFFYATSTDLDSVFVDHSYHRDIQSATESVNYYSNYASLNSASSSGFNFWGAHAESRVTDPQYDLVYSVAELTGQSEPNQFGINENDSIYSLAQLPQTT
ncbi:uncharacterized protein [Pempheris klunzingeri]|uniref:uncharacterized protein n=1 Tax=Pempheris klunzingeri TaxID=3127111 RepID=UPI0039818CB2